LTYFFKTADLGGGEKWFCGFYFFKKKVQCGVQNRAAGSGYLVRNAFIV
jgi:hypothetical protein